MQVEELIKKYMAECKMMQVASSAGDQPWVCTVFYAEDADQNLYWLSLPTRRHSKEIALNNKVAITIPVKFDKNPIIGIQADGTAEVVMTTSEVAKLMEAYTSKHDAGHDFAENFAAGTNDHQLYKFTPSKYYLFDEVNFNDGQKREWNPHEEKPGSDVYNIKIGI